MLLWMEWLRCAAELRPACRRRRTFAWMLLVLAGLSTRPERAGVTSIVRVLHLQPEAYRRILNLFHSAALCLGRLTELWGRLVPKLFTPVTVGPYRVCVVDGIKVAKEGKRMPAVKRLHQSSGSNSKAPYIMGHSFQAVSLLVRGTVGYVTAIPLVARICEGLIWSNRDKRTILDKTVALFLSLNSWWQGSVILVADAYYASRTVIVPLLEHGHHLVTRCRSNAVAYYPAPKSEPPRRGRPKLYGDKVRLKDMARESHEFITVPSPCYNDSDVELRYRCIDLLWRSVGRTVRFVIVHHPQRGTIFLLSTNCDLQPLEIIQLYSHRFKIEVGFKHALYVLGSYAYHFWMKEMTPIRARTGNQHLHMTTERYREHVRRKMKAYHVHVQLGCIAQGLLQHLSVNFGSQVWSQFRSWLRTMDHTRPPSELVTAHAMRNWIPEFLDVTAQDPNMDKLLTEVRLPLNQGKLRRAA